MEASTLVSTPDTALAAPLALLEREAARLVDRQIANDPVRFVRRYADPRDQEIAGVFAASLAYGRVSLFLPVLDDLFRRFDARGGPRAYIDSFDVAADTADLAPIVYRWNRGVDLALLCAALQDVVGAGRLSDHAPAGPAFDTLNALVGALRAGVVRVAPQVGAAADRWEDLPRGLRALLPMPNDGSACKRWNLFLRWMVRRDAVDVGAWPHLSPASLIIPLDVHIGRICRLLGLCTRTADDWRTAETITAALRSLDGADPVRFDFAIAHLGISQGCTGRRQPAVCAPCALRSACTAWEHRAFDEGLGPHD